MPRPNKKRHPVKLVREAIGLSQKEFAAVVGHSKDTIQAIEIGRHNPSLALAEKIFVQTGAIPKTLRKVDTIPLDIEGEPYTRDSYQRWTTTINSRSARLAGRERGAIKYLNWLVATLQYAALRAGKLFAVQYQLDRHVAELVREFGLKRNIAGLLRDRPHTRFGWLQMFDWRPGEPSRLMRRYVVRGEKGLSFGQQEIFGFSRAHRDRRAAISARTKLQSGTERPCGLAGRQTTTTLNVKLRSKRSPRHRVRRKRHTRCPRHL